MHLIITGNSNTKQNTFSEPSESRRTHSQASMGDVFVHREP